MYVGILRVIGEIIAGEMNVSFQFRHYSCQGTKQNLMLSRQKPVSPVMYKESKKLNLTHLEKNKGDVRDLEGFYQKNFDEAKWILKQGNEDVQSFYELFPDWTAKQKQEEENLLYWFKPDERPKRQPEVYPEKRKSSLDIQTSKASSAARSRSE